MSKGHWLLKDVLTRDSAKDEMKRLAEKYPNGFDDFKERAEVKILRTGMDVPTEPGLIVVHDSATTVQ